MSDSRFNQVVNGMGDPISITTETTLRGTDGGHGFYDPSQNRIVIGRHNPAPLKHVILLHEALHLVDQQLVGYGVTKRQIPHAFIECGAPLLLAFLTKAGFWKDGPTLRALDKAMRAEHAKDKRRASPTGSKDHG